MHPGKINRTAPQGGDPLLQTTAKGVAAIRNIITETLWKSLPHRPTGTTKTACKIDNLRRPCLTLDLFIDCSQASLGSVFWPWGRVKISMSGSAGMYGSTVAARDHLGWGEE
jgi:hypothetical protein